ncbi:MAG: hypothetical protein K6E35_06345 [Bacteroidales bacterium]|nr:hypothetical protein [Bacteroidales bacterium]
MKKKTLVILLPVVLLCVAGVVLSKTIKWPVDSSNASGNISKSSRFSRKTAAKGLSNMQELLLSDENFCNEIVTAYVVMQARAQEFGSLVDLSAKAAGELPAFANVLKEMDEIKPLVENVCVAMTAASEDLSSALSGNDCQDLAQNTSNAALAYSSLQKQNQLADEFIKVTDEYLQENSASDQLKFIRDQWVGYQQMSAYLNQDKKSSAELDEKGYLLSPEQTAAALNSFPSNNQINFINGAQLNALALQNTPLNEAFNSNLLNNNENVVLIRNAAQANLNNASQASLNNASQASLNNASQASLNNASQASLNNASQASLNNASQASLNNASQASLNNASQASLNNASQASLNNASQASLNNASQASLNNASQASLNNASQASLNNFSQAFINNASQANLNESSKAALNLYTLASFTGMVNLRGPVSNQSDAKLNSVMDMLNNVTAVSNSLAAGNIPN